MVRVKMPLTVSAEGRLLLACATPTSDPLLVPALLRERLDWSGLVARAVEHGMVPLLYVALKAAPRGEAGPPEEVLRQLRTLYYWYAARYANIAAKLGEAGEAFTRAGIPVIALKGLALASTVYQNPALRPMRDVDLLVRRDDLVAAERLLRELGYAPNESWRSAAWYSDRHHHLVPHDAADGSLSVELHHAIVKPGAVLVPTDELWDRARPARVGSATLLVLAPPDLLLHLCLHLGHDNAFWDGTLRDLRDLAETIRRDPDAIRWDEVVERARTWQASRYVYYALWLARDMVGAAVPPNVLADLAEARSDQVADRLLRRVLRQSMLRPEPGPFAMPRWVMYETCPILLGDGNAGVTIARLARLAARRFRESARQVGPARGVLAALYLPVHPLYLVARAFGRDPRGRDRTPPARRGR